ncbi:MAG: DUF4388 domain-containing protein [Proteobacteria bacterium]|nr:DUF4388 domain-containing protein [Pseudomonadota bacterium]
MGARRRHRGSAARLDGNLCDVTALYLIDLCRRRTITGTLTINSWGQVGRVDFRAGKIAGADFGASRGQAALEELCELRDGMFELVQQLPSIEAGVYSDGEVRADLDTTSLAAIVHQCGEQALTCLVTISDPSSETIADLEYRAGELVRVNDVSGDSELAHLDLTGLGGFLISIRSLPLAEPTEPFERPGKRGGKRSIPSKTAERPSIRSKAIAPPIPHSLQTPPPLPTAHQSPPVFLRDSSPQSENPAVESRRAVEPRYPEVEPAATMAHPGSIEAATMPDKAWVDPNWIERTRNLQWAYLAQTNGLTRRHPMTNTVVGLGLIFLTILMGMVASHL